MIVNSVKNVLFIVKLLLIEDVFLKKPGCKSGNNGESSNLNLFTIKYSTFASGILLYQYKRQARNNWYAIAKTRKVGNTLFEDNINDIIGRNATVFLKNNNNV